MSPAQSTSPEIDAAASTFERYPHWSNWSGTQTSTPERIVRPRDEAEAVAIVREAIATGSSLRPLGGGYSFTPVAATGGILVDTRLLTGITSVDSDRHRFRVRSGTRIYDLGEQLWEHGMSLSILGAFDRQTIAGAISTGTHGSSTRLGNISSFVTGVRFIDGRGEVREVSESDPELLAALQVSLGLLGVILEVEMQAEPRFFLQTAFSFPYWSESGQIADSEAESTRHYTTMWFSHEESVKFYPKVVPPDDQPMKDRTWIITYDDVAYDPEMDRTRVKGRFSTVSRNYEALVLSDTDDRSDDGITPFHEAEYSVERTRAFEALEELQWLMRREPEPVRPLFLRWVQGDSALISPFHGRDSVTFSIAGDPAGGYWPFFKRYHDLLSRYDARGHWGKLHMFDRDYLERVYPRLSDFIALRKEFDPAGIFLNDHLRPLFT